MSLPESELAKLSPESRRHYEESLERFNRFKSEQFISKPAPIPRSVSLPAVLVDRVVGGDASKQSSFLPTSVESTPPQQPPPEGSFLEINGYQEFHNIAKKYNLMRFDSRVKDFVAFMDKIPHLCGCVRNQLHNSARNSFSRNLPLIQAENMAFFEEFKKAANVQKLVFKEGNLVLLQV